MGFALAQEERTDRLRLALRQRARLRVGRGLHPDVIDETEHAELLEVRMRYRTAAFALLERTPADRSFLRFQRPLEEDGAVQCLLPLLRKMLFFAYCTELRQVMRVA